MASRIETLASTTELLGSAFRQPKMVQVLLVDDDAAIRDSLSAGLTENGLAIVTAEDANTALEIFRKIHPRIVLLDLGLPDRDGMDVLAEMLQIDPGAQILLLTGNYSTDKAVEAIRKGAFDYITKPAPLNVLRERLTNVIENLERRSVLNDVQRTLLDSYSFHGIVGRSPQMIEVFERIERIAPHFRSVLVTGATGTGKEVVARALHECSPVAKGPFIVCNSAALVETLAESELFGYMRGAFTGAQQDRAGLFEHADGGTLFLDEIGEMPLKIQAKLLRVLQDQQVQRVGAARPRQINVRIIAATNRDLQKNIEAGNFRSDLFFRLSMVEISLPKLRGRGEDLALLQRCFVDKFAKLYNKKIDGISLRAQKLMAEFSWPGNVRELEHVIGYAAMMTEGTFIDVQHLPDYLREQRGPTEEADTTLLSFDELQRRHAAKVLAALNGNKQKAAHVLGISRATLYSLLSKMEAPAR